jgi:hypothetical protein
MIYVGIDLHRKRSQIGSAGRAGDGAAVAAGRERAGGITGTTRSARCPWFTAGQQPSCPIDAPGNHAGGMSSQAISELAKWLG